MTQEERWNTYGSWLTFMVNGSWQLTVHGSWLRVILGSWLKVNGYGLRKETI